MVVLVALSSSAAAAVDVEVLVSGAGVFARVLVVASGEATEEAWGSAASSGASPDGSRAARALWMC